MKNRQIIRTVVMVLVIVCILATRYLTSKSRNDSNKTGGVKISSEKRVNRSTDKKGNDQASAEKGNSNNKTNQNKNGKNTVSGESKGNRKYNIDYDHIIGGDISANGEKVTGGHTLLRGDVRILKRIGKPSPAGVYKANVEIRKPDGSWQKKTSNGGINTMFPDDWDEARVIDEINSAWENRKDLKGRDSNMWQGMSRSGVIIRGYKSPRITAYPFFEGDRQ